MSKSSKRIGGNALRKLPVEPRRLAVATRAAALSRPANHVLRAALLAVLATQAFAAYSPAVAATAATAAQLDLDRDGIPNGRDRDVDGDGLLNGVDRNIDGGVIASGPMKGRYVGDRLANNDPAELDMDGDGLADDSPQEKDIDGDFLADNSLQEKDIDGDGIADNSPQETDIDGDGLADNSSQETDIDGDGIDDASIAEVDIDGDGTANGADTNIDGDGIVNTADADLDGTGQVDDILSYDQGCIEDGSADAIKNFVATEVRSRIAIQATDPGLRVCVQPEWKPGVRNGLWRYLSADNIQVWAKWAYPTSNPSNLQIFIQWSYGGPYTDNTENYYNPAFYSISEESRFVASFPRGDGATFSQSPGYPVGFYYIAPSEELTGRPLPIKALQTALGGYPDFANYGDSFAGSLVPELTSIAPVLTFMRQAYDATRKDNAVFEAQVISAESAAAAKGN
jgi:hypothetical protein